MAWFSRRSCYVLIIISVILLLSVSLHPASRIRHPLHRTTSVTSITPTSPPFRHTRIFVASAFAAHFDVYLIFAGTLHRLLASSLPRDQFYVKAYASLPMRYRFQDVIDMKTGLYEGEIVHNAQFHNDFENAFKGQD